MSQTVQASMNANNDETIGPSTVPAASITQLPVRYASWISEHNVPFWVCSIGMIVMLLWAGAYKMTAPGAEGIVPLVRNSPFTSWQFKVFGTYKGSDVIGLTEWTAALLMLLGFRWPKVGILGAIVATVMFFTTSTMLITTPETLVSVNGLKYMTFLGLFLYKDVISLGVSFFLASSYGKRAAIAHTSR